MTQMNLTTIVSMVVCIALMLVAYFTHSDAMALLTGISGVIGHLLQPPVARKDGQ